MQAIVSLLIACVLLGTPLVRCPAAYAQIRQPARSDATSLQDVADKIKQQKKKLAQVEKEEAAVISRLNAIEKKLLQEGREYTSIAQEINQLQDDIHKTRIGMTSLEHTSREQEQIVQQRLNALYKYYRRSGLRILLSSRNYNDLLRTEQALGLIVDRDHELLSRSLSRLKKQRQHEAKLHVHQNQLIAARDRIFKKREQIKDTQQQRSSHLNKIQQEKSLQIKALKELETQSKKLQKVIDTLPGKKKYTSSGIKFSKKRGRLPFPVKGKITSRFGRTEHPKLKTYTYQKGITIKAPAGKPVKTVHDGRVIFADWFKGYGLMIIVDHGEHYYSLSAHASQLLKKVDDVVFAGETIATVGDTNSIKGPGLYFEIRLRGKPQNPLKWLKKGGNK